MSADVKTYLLDELQVLLQKQIELIRRSDFSGFEALTEQTGSIVEKIAKKGAFERSEFNEQRERLAKLYKKLIIIVAAQKGQVARQLRRINEGKKTLGAYRDSS
jgi:hypothetical protein